MNNKKENCSIYTQECIERNADKINVECWEDISLNFNFSDASDLFMDRFLSEFDWQLISGNQNLSQNFIKRYINKLDWDIISKDQNLLSEIFIREFLSYLNIETILSRNELNLSEDFKKELRQI